MNTNPSSIEKNVMRRVHIIRALRLLSSGTVVATLVLLLTLWGIGREVWVAHVFANGPQGPLGHLQYLSYAFFHTRLLVQTLVVVSGMSLVYLARETAIRVTRIAVPLFA